MTKRGMSDADAKDLTVRIRTQSVEFFGASMEDLEQAAYRFAEMAGYDLFGTEVKERKGVTYLVATYTNPYVPWVSPDEPLTITFRSAERKKEEN